MSKVFRHQNPTYGPAKAQRAKEKDKRDKVKGKAFVDPAELYALEGDRGYDADDIQEFFIPPGSPQKVPDELMRTEQIVPDGGVIAESQFPDEKDYVKEFGIDPRAKKRKGVLEGLDSASAGSARKAAGAKPKSRDVSYDQLGTAFDSRFGGDPAKQAQQMDYLAQFEPLPFDTLMKELCQWFIPTGKDYCIFPFHILRCSDYLWLFMGKRRTGKTTLWKTIMPQIAPMYPFVYVFAGTRFNSAFSDYVPDKVVFKGFQEGVVTEIMNKQEEKVELNLRLFDRFNEYEDPDALQMMPNPYIHCVFDDCVADKQCHSAECLNELAFYGRHYRCGTVITTQHGHALNPGDPDAKPLKLGCMEYWKMYGKKDGAGTTNAAGAELDQRGSAAPVYSDPNFDADGSFIPNSQYTPRFTKFFDF